MYLSFGCFYKFEIFSLAFLKTRCRIDDKTETLRELKFYLEFYCDFFFDRMTEKRKEAKSFGENISLNRPKRFKY